MRLRRKHWFFTNAAIGRDCSKCQFPWGFETPNIKDQPTKTPWYFVVAWLCTANHCKVSVQKKLDVVVFEATTTTTRDRESMLMPGMAATAAIIIQTGCYEFINAIWLKGIGFLLYLARYRNCDSLTGIIIFLLFSGFADFLCSI